MQRKFRERVLIFLSISMASMVFGCGSNNGVVICGSFRDKRLIQYFSRCDVLASTPHS